MTHHASILSSLIQLLRETAEVAVAVQYDAPWKR